MWHKHKRSKGNDLKSGTSFDYEAFCYEILSPSETITCFCRCSIGDNIIKSNQTVIGTKYLNRLARKTSSYDTRNFQGVPRSIKDLPSLNERPDSIHLIFDLFNLLTDRQPVIE